MNQSAAPAQAIVPHAKISTIVPSFTTRMAMLSWQPVAPSTIQQPAIQAAPFALQVILKFVLSAFKGSTSLLNSTANHVPLPVHARLAPDLTLQFA